MRGTNKLVKRVFAEVVGKPFLRALIFPYFVLMFVLAAVDATIDWQASRRVFATLAPLSRAAVLTALVVFWSVVAGQALRPVWRQRTMSFLVRQPLSSREWARRLLPSLLIALVPIAGVLWLTGYGTDLLGHYLGFIGLALPIVLAVSLHSSGRVQMVGAVVSAFALLAITCAFFPVAAYAGIPLTVLLYFFSAAAVQRQGVVEIRRRASWLSSSSAVGALLLRDCRAVLRARKGVIAETLVVSALVSLMMLAFRVNGEVQGRDALDLACLMFLFAATAAYRNLEIAKDRLGLQLMRAEWPLPYAERGAALALLTAVFMAASVLPIAILGSTMGLLNLAAFLLFVTATIAMTTALFALTLNAASSSVGLFMNLIVFHGVLVFVAPVWVTALLDAGFILASLPLINSGLRRFALVSQPGAHEFA